MKGHLFRYVLTRSATGLLVAFLVVLGLVMLVDFVEANRDLDADIPISALQLLYLTALKTPSLIEETIPFIVLFGMMGAIHGMNRRSELIVMRASGLSAWAILRPALILAGMIGLAWSMLLNPLANGLDARFEQISAQWLQTGQAAVEKDIWLREGQSDKQWVIRASSIDWSERTLHDTDFIVLQLDADGRTQFIRRYDAPYARLLPSGYWQLFDVIENAPNEPIQRHSAISLPTTLDIQTVRDRTVDQSRIAFWSIPRTISENRKAGFSTRALRLEFNRLLSLPVLLIAMTFIAAGVSMQLTREGGTLRLLITGTALGFAVFFANSTISAFGEVSIVPVIFAAWSVPLIVLFLGVAHLARIEDG